MYVVKRKDTSLSGISDFFTVYDLYIWLGICGFFFIITLLGAMINFVELKFKGSSGAKSRVLSVSFYRFFFNEKYVEETLVCMDSCSISTNATWLY